jgi:predicted amidohydrolase YtcJ
LVLPVDPFTVPPAEIERIPVGMTVVGGRVSYCAG